MSEDFRPEDYRWIEELLAYPGRLADNLSFFDTTEQIAVPEDPIERVVFQDRAKAAIRKVAQNRGHVLMVGRPGTGKSMLANMFKEVLDRSVGEYIRPGKAIVAYPGKDENHIRIAYERPETVERRLDRLREQIEAARDAVGEFSLADQIASVRRVKTGLLFAAAAAGAAGFFFPPAFVVMGLTGIGAIFMYIQENNHRAQERIQQEAGGGRKNAVKHISDQVPEVLYDPRRQQELMARVAEPNSANMKGGFRHDPYQSGNLQTPAHRRAYLGAHARAPIIYIDEIKTLVRAGYMPDLLEIMQNREYILEGGRQTGSGAADRAVDPLRAENILIACCNHDTLETLQREGDGAFLSRIEDKGEVIQLESAVPETPETVRQVAQYVKQEVDGIGMEFAETWGQIRKKEGYAGIRRRSEQLMGRRLPEDYRLQPREFSREAILEIVKELRCRASDGKLSAMLRPINGIVRGAEFEAIFENSPDVRARHVRRAKKEHFSLEGALARDLVASKKDLKNYIGTLTDAIGYVVGLAVIVSGASGQMYGQPLPIHGQVNAGGADTVSAPGKIGDIARAAAQNVRASIKRVLAKIDAPYVGYEMHIEYIQAHGGVEGDSASAAIDIALISDFIRQPVNQKYGVTGSLTGDIILPVGGVTEKIRTIMDPDLGMEGACIPWQNRQDAEPLLVNTEAEAVEKEGVPGVRIFRAENRTEPFDIYFCKTKYNAYRILMGLDAAQVEAKMAERSRRDLERQHQSTALSLEETMALHRCARKTLPVDEK